METFDQTSKKLTFVGFVALFSAALVGGLVVGGIAHLVGRFIFLILLFPMLIGAGVGGLIHSTVLKQKIRIRWVVILAAFVGGIAAYGGMHYFDNLRFRGDALTYLREQAAQESDKQFTDAQLGQILDYSLQETYGLDGFLGYLLMRVDEGISLKSIHSSSETNLGKFTWLYWLIELVFCSGTAISIVKDAPAQPFCEICESWYAREAYMGSVGSDKASEALNLFKTQQYEMLGEILQEDIPVPGLSFWRAGCKTCTSSPTFLSVYMLQRGGKGQVVRTRIVKADLSGAQNARMLSAIKQDAIS